MNTTTRNEDTITVTFDLNGGQMSETQLEIPKNSKIDTSQLDPSKENAVFYMWYTDPELENMFFDWQRLTEDITLYARWGSEISRDAFSDDMLRKLELSYGVTGQISDLELQDINSFDSTELFFNEDTNEYENVVVYDYKGIQYLTNIETLTLGIDKEHLVSDDSLEYLGALKNVQYLTFKDILPIEYTGSWMEYEQYIADNLNNKDNATLYQHEIVRYLNAMDFEATRQKDYPLYLNFDYSLSFFDQTFLMDWNVENLPINVSINAGEIYNTFYANL
ncbi:InlB B-repeat-containing protein [Erysipelothrix sp. D19-032]